VSGVKARVRSSSFHLPVIGHIEHGYSLREIATRFGLSVTTVHRRVHACGDGGRSSLAPAAGETKKT
jgi:transposase